MSRVVTAIRNTERPPDVQFTVKVPRRLKREAKLEATRRFLPFREYLLEAFREALHRRRA